VLPRVGILIWLPSMSNRVLSDVPSGEAVPIEQDERASEVYPLGRMGCGGDARFTYGLALDVAAVLARHGYPPVRAAADLIRVQQSLFELIYGPR
jgi:hypothetical protein